MQDQQVAPTAGTDDQAPLTRRGRGIAIVGIFFAASAVWIYPLVLGAAAVVCGLYSVWRGDRLGRLAIILGVALGIGGFFFQKLPEHFFA